MRRTPTIRARRGIMLVEVLLALAIAGMVAAGVASLLLAVGNGTRDRQDLRRRNVRVDVLATRMDAAVRSSSMLLGRDGSCLVLWIADTRRNDRPDLSELRRIEWDSAAQQVRCYQAPAGLADSDDTTHALTSDFVALTAGLKGTASFPGETWGNGITAWTTTPVDATQSTRLIGCTLTVTTAAGTHTFRSAAALRGASGMRG